MCRNPDDGAQDANDEVDQRECVEQRRVHRRDAAGGLRHSSEARARDVDHVFDPQVEPDFASLDFLVLNVPAAAVRGGGVVVDDDVAVATAAETVLAHGGLFVVIVVASTVDIDSFIIVVVLAWGEPGALDTLRTHIIAIIVILIFRLPFLRSRSLIMAFRSETVINRFKHQPAHMGLHARRITSRSIRNDGFIHHAVPVRSRDHFVVPVGPNSDTSLPGGRCGQLAELDENLGSRGVEIRVDGVEPVGPWVFTHVANVFADDGHGVDGVVAHFAVLRVGEKFREVAT